YYRVRHEALLGLLSSDSYTVNERRFEVYERMSPGRIKFTRPPRGYAYEPHRYWLLDLEKNSAARMGDLPGLPNFTFQPSPDLRYGYSPLHGAGDELDVYRFDFKRRSIKKLDVHGWPSGWWDQTNILILTTNNDFVLHDVT